MVHCGEDLSDLCRVRGVGPVFIALVNISAISTGSVRAAADRIRLLVQFIDAVGFDLEAPPFGRTALMVIKTD